jgi:hypothetical protein
LARLFTRKARIIVGTSASTGVAVEQHRCAFAVEKTLKPEPNTCTLQVWNLSRAQRAAIEEMKPSKGKPTGVPVLIEAGYDETGTSQIFLGDLRTVFSAREGPDWITTVESGDGEKATATARINVALGRKTSPEVALRAIVKALGLKPGNLTTALQKLKRSGVAQLFTHGVTLSGSASYHMTNFCKSADLEWSIQDGAIQILDRGKTLAKTAVRLSSETGLVESPTVDHKGVLSCKMLMIPDVRPGSLLVLDSLTVKGNYRIEKAKWSGDTHGKDWTIEVEAKRY